MVGENLLRVALISIAIAFAARNNYKYHNTLLYCNEPSIAKARRKTKTVFIAASTVAVLLILILILPVFL